MARETLQTLYLNELRDLYSAEQQLVKALPKMAKNAESQDLSDAFISHLDETKNHVARLEQIFESLGESPKGKKCAGMEGIVEEGSETIDEYEGSVLDAAMISAAPSVEHYAMAAYRGSVRICPVARPLRRSRITQRNACRGKRGLTKSSLNCRTPLTKARWREKNRNHVVPGVRRKPGRLPGPVETDCEPSAASLSCRGLSSFQSPS
jgi:ferritin-like metal-binding protein YciE